MCSSRLKFGMYVEKGTYKCSDCNKMVTMEKRGFLPCCSSYDDIPHNENSWMLVSEKPEQKQNRNRKKSEAE